MEMRADLEQFVDEQVKAGHYPDREALLSAAVIQMMKSDVGEELDQDTLDALDEAEAQIERGEFFTLDEVKERFRKRFEGTGK